MTPTLSLPACRRWIALLAIGVGALAVVPSAHAQPKPAEPPTELDRAITLLAEARQSFQSVQDYQCRLVKRERIGGVLQPEAEMTMKVRNKPFSVYLRSESPGADKGLEICYVAGRNDGRMRVHPTGLLGYFGFFSVDPRDPRVFEKSRHAITDAGFATLLESTARYWETERRLNKTLVSITDDKIGGRDCVRMETIHPDRDAGKFYGYRCVLWLDKATHLPAGAETYDWPRPGGPPQGDLLESYRYLDLRCNCEFGDEQFVR